MPANGEIVKDVFDQFQKYEGQKKDEPLYSNIC